MVSVFCVGIGEFLTFSSMVLAILVNMGQITTNRVAAAIYYTSLDTTSFQSAVRSTANTGGNNVASIYAPDQSATELAGNGIKNVYKWGLYNFCGGQSTGSDRSCDARSFGYEFRPLDVLVQDATSQNRNDVNNAIPNGVFADTTYLSRYSRPASYLAFVGTVVIGASFLVAFLAHRFAFLLASLLALAACGCMFVAASIWTALIYRARANLRSGSSGLNLMYGNALWMEWAAAAAAFLSVIPLLVACISGRRSKY